ncbi:MAG: DUF2330 domain-containing protein [bacterium]|nr:DUF2330 domain-containing protein [bacterium]
MCGARIVRGVSRRGVVVVGVLLVVIGWFIAPQARACGGFFCQSVPIDQAGEQIIFRQDGEMVTAVVLIQYEGPSEEFSWVLPVPGVPEVTLASDLVFAPLELATRPQFQLTVEGAGCVARNAPSADSGGGAAEGAVDEDGGGVEVLEELDVGPFAIQIVSSDDPQAMATWLEDNDYDLTDRGTELIAPYVEDGMNFVAMKLRQDQGVGDIQPIMLSYQSTVPMIPIRLTAVAALEDMGIIVWMLGEARAVPLNYPHVEVNYTRLNWFNGSAFAYADYQDLVTDAMNEVGGLGFATDYAGDDLDVVAQLPDPDALRDEVALLDSQADSLDFYAALISSFVLPQARTEEILRRQLPLPEGADEVIYSSPSLLVEAFDEQTLTDARTAILDELVEANVVPLEATLAVFEGTPYMTRLYTTLSPEEMSLDPTFSFNPDLPGQPLVREATLRLSCQAGSTLQELILGPGTGREDELVVQITGQAAFPTIEQSAVTRSLRLSTSGAGDVETENSFAPVTASGPADGVVPAQTGGGGGLCGLGLFAWLPVGLIVLFAWRWTQTPKR